MLTAAAGIDSDRLFSPLDLASRSSVVAAVSGGSDSTALLILLKQFLDRSAPGTKLAAATVDHALRPDSAEEAKAVGRLCSEIGVIHRILTWTGAKPEAGLPAAAREARHDLLAQAAAAENTDLVLTGHTADDQAETVLMRQARDTGRGLAGMAPATLFDGRVWFARPLLATRREALRDFLRRRGTGWIDDPTNLNQTFERPRLRKTLGGAGGEASIEAALQQAGEAALRREALGAAAATLIRVHADRPVPGLIRVDPGMLDADPAAAIYALRILLAVVGGTPHLPDEARATALHTRLLEGSSFRAVLSRTLIDRRKNGTFLHREARGLPEPGAVTDGVMWDGRYRIFAPSLGLLRPPGEEIWGTGAPTIVSGLNEPGGEPPLPDGQRVADPELVAGGGRVRGKRADAEISPSLMRLALAAQPTLPPADVRSFSWCAAPLVAPWARFLPSFDLIAARAAAALIEAPEIPAPPFQEHIRRKA